MNYRIVKDDNGEMSFQATVEIPGGWCSQTWARGTDLESVRQAGFVAIERVRTPPMVVEEGQL
jgi:hypothetical protein